MFGTFGEHALKAQGCNLSTDIIAVDERRVASYGWLPAKEFFNLGSLLLHIERKSLGVGQ